MSKLTRTEIRFLLSHLVNCFKAYHCGLTGASIHNTKSNIPSFVHLSKTWNLGTIFAESGLTWGEFQKMYNEVTREEINKIV